MNSVRTRLKKFFTIKNSIILAVVIIGLIAVTVFLWEPIVQLLGERHKVEEFILSFGVFAPLVFIVLQILQVIFAPIPGNVTSFIGGYMFGWWGLLMTVIGTTIGFIIIVLLTRRFGRPLVEKFFKKEQIAKFDHIINNNGVMALFLIFLFPFFPDDLLSFLAGLTKIPLYKLIIVCIVGRLPGFLLLNLAGSGVNSGDTRLIVGIVVAVAAIGMLIFWKKDWISQFIKADNHLEFLKQSLRKIKRKNKI